MRWNDKITVFRADCMEIMSNYPDGYFDLAIVDPPYGIGEDGRKTKGREGFVKQKNGSKIFLPAKNYALKGWDDKIPSDKYFIELFRVAKSQIIFGANYFPYIFGRSEKPPRRNEYPEWIRDHPKGFILWDKVNGNSDQADCEVIYTSFDFDSFVLEYMWAGFCQGKSIAQGTIQIGDKTKNQDRKHPTEKPAKIYEWILNNYAKPNFKIIDTHLGRGWHAIVGHYNLNCGEFVGCELDADYYRESHTLFKRETAQIRMFT